MSLSKFQLTVTGKMAELEAKEEDWLLEDTDSLQLVAQVTLFLDLTHFYHTALIYRILCILIPYFEIIHQNTLN